MFLHQDNTHVHTAAFTCLPKDLSLDLALLDFALFSLNSHLKGIKIEHSGELK